MCISCRRFATRASRKSRSLGPEAEGGHLWCYNGAGSPIPSRIYLAQGSIRESMTITAKYEDGVFKPLEDVSISEGTIVEVRVPSYADRLKSKARSVGDFAFYGMWKDRTDIGDSVEYISELRRKLRG